MSKKRSFLLNALALFLCLVMLLGSTYAWFTDLASSKDNVIHSGVLDVEMYWSDTLIPENSSDWKKAESASMFTYDKWEPGYTEVKYIKVENAGNLSFKWKLNIEAQGDVSKLAEVVDVYCVNPVVSALTEGDINAGNLVGTLADTIGNSEGIADGVLLTSAQANEELPSIDTILAVAFRIDAGVGNEYMGLSMGDGFALTVSATQFNYEQGSFGDSYDSGAEWPNTNLVVKNSASAPVNTTPENKVADKVTLISDDKKIFADVPAGVQLDPDVDTLTLTVADVLSSKANVTLDENEAALSIDVHVNGVAENNDVVMPITIKELLPVGLNMGNYRFYHVENGATVEMELLTAGATPVHNNYDYNPATGDVVLYLKSFSEVALVADTENAWGGSFDYSWYTEAIKSNSDTKSFTIANADQLAAFGAIVGGMAKKDSEGIIYTSVGVDENATVIQDSFKDKTVKLLADINIGDLDSENGIVFYPIGYNSSDGKYERTGVAVTTGFYNFSGTFDGNGNTIANFYHNTWEMKGDNNYYDATLQYYRDGMGLFGRVYGGTIKNLTVSNFSSDGEYTTTGVIAAYADGATFENIAITNCNPRVYNIGNGGIVGCVGWYAKEENLKTTFTNITVDNSNKISALWGSYDVACGGIVGQYYPTSGQTVNDAKPANGGIHFDNCHISAQMDVYNDVCANYQYYAYRYAGMMIGSIRENTTNEDGKTIPDMTGISATNCTVNYGDWNDYYYCEFEKNGHPSYSGPDDYKFSRVPHSELNFTDSNGNGVVDADERASVTGCKHSHTDKENNQAIFLPFYQLFTGYGWGVNSIGLEKYSGIVTNLDITEGDQQESVEKFKGKVTELANNKEYKLGDIFNFVDNGVELVPGALTVSIVNLDENNPVSATIVYDRENWENGTITLTGTGEITITIQDYYFCTPTTIEVTVNNRQNAEKFDVVMNNGDFLHRVGNNGTVALDKLFKAKDGVTVGTVSVTIEAVNGTGASGTYSNNAIQFNGTGVVKVTITDNDYCIPTELYLEVVEATNLTSATGTTTGGTFVLLCNVNTTTYVNYWNCTLYGNGFTYSLKGAPTDYNSKQGHGVLITKNATLDNLVIIGDVYNSYGAYTNQDYYNTAIDVAGDTTIQNCYVSGCAAPVRVRAGNANIKNTTLYGGSVANLIIDACTTTLENVTTANYDDDSRTLVGMGIVIHSDATETAKLVLNGTLTQYNFVSESKVPTDTYAKNLHNAMFSSDCSQYHFGTSPNRYVNTGIISLTSTFNGEDITDNAKTGYVGKSLSVSSYDGYVYTQPNTSGSVNNNYPEYKPTTQGAVPPSYSFDYTNKNYIAKTDGSNDYCYEENGKVNISMDQGDTFNWDTSILTIGKGITNYTVSMNGVDYTGKSIAFNTAGDYTVTYTYTDANNNKLDENGNITTYSVTYTKNVTIVVAVVEATTKHAEFTFGSSNTASTTVTIGNSTYVMPNVSGTSSTIGSTTVSGQTIYYPIVEIIMSDGKTSHSSGWYAYFPVFSGAVTITDYADKGTGDKMTPYNGSTTTMPSGLSVVGDPTQLFKYQSKSTAGATPVEKNDILVYSSAKIEADRGDVNVLVQYSYTDNASATFYYYIGYHAPKQTYSPSCVTPDTLVTLADGTQKRIDQVTYNDQLLVWNHFTGKYDVAPAAIIFNHGYDNNTIIKLSFSDGTTVKVANIHQFYDNDLNRYVTIDADSVAQYVGHSFAKQSGDGFTTVTLDSYEISVEYEAAYGIISALHYNIIVEGMLSTDFMLEDYDLFNYFDFGENMVFDEESMQADIEKYGLYTYEDFADYLTYEQFVAFNVQYFKIPVEKGLYTYEGILALIDEYLR